MSAMGDVGVMVMWVVVVGGGCGWWLWDEARQIELSGSVANGCQLKWYS